MKYLLDVTHVLVLISFLLDILDSKLIILLLNWSSSHLTRQNLSPFAASRDHIKIMLSPEMSGQLPIAVPLCSSVIASQSPFICWFFNISGFKLVVLNGPCYIDQNLWINRLGADWMGRKIVYFITGLSISVCADCVDAYYWMRQTFFFFFLMFRLVSWN